MEQKQLEDKLEEQKKKEYKKAVFYGVLTQFYKTKYEEV